ncbi:hypothetical protein QE152_g34203, partial [Popillia japonica]
MSEFPVERSDEIDWKLKMPSGQLRGETLTETTRTTLRRFFARSALTSSAGKGTKKKKRRSELAGQ